MIPKQIYHEVKNYTPKNVLIPFTLTFFLILGFKIWQIVDIYKNNLSSFYFYPLILSGLFIIISNYFLTFYSLINAALSKRGYRFSIAIISFLMVIFLNLQAIYEIAHSKYLNNAILYFTISILIFWILNHILHSNYYAKFLNITLTIFFINLLFFIFVFLFFLFSYFSIIQYEKKNQKKIID